MAWPNMKTQLEVRTIQHVVISHSKSSGYVLFGIERDVKNTDGQLTPSHILVSHRPHDAQVSQIYRLPADPESSSELQRITHFDIGSGRNIQAFQPIIGEDWRGVWRGGGAIMGMDSDGSETFQLWSVR